MENKDSNISPVEAIWAREAPESFQSYQSKSEAVLFKEAMLPKDVEHGDKQKKLLDQRMGFGYGTVVEEPATPRYWGRFDIPDAGSATALPAGTVEDSMPMADATVDTRGTRVTFIRKVYTILVVQLFVTFVSCAFMTFNQSASNFVLGEMEGGLTLLNYGIGFLTIIGLHFYKRSYPINYIILSIFTLSISYMVGTVTVAFHESGAGDLVLEAIGITAVVFIILTVYTLNSKHDFSFLGAGLGVGLLIMFLWGLAAIIFGLQTGFVYGLLGSLLFSSFIIYDTYMLAERHDPEDYVIAAVELYLDIINLFLYILQMLAEAEG